MILVFTMKNLKSYVVDDFVRKGRDTLLIFLDREVGRNKKGTRLIVLFMYNDQFINRVSLSQVWESLIIIF